MREVFFCRYCSESIEVEIEADEFGPHDIPEWLEPYQWQAIVDDRKLEVTIICPKCQATET